MNLLNIASGAWGFLVGFVGWYGCLLGAQPLAEWLAPPGLRPPRRRVVVPVLVMLFLINSVLVALSLPPLIMCHGTCDTAEWRHAFGAAFVCSLLGFYACLWLRRGRAKGASQGS
jgi:hypothetical protein